MRRIMLAGIIVCLASCSVGAAVLCTRKSGSGTLRIRAACQRNEQLVDPAAIGLQGLKGDTGPAGPSLVVRDVNGAFVGQVIGPTYTPVSPPPAPVTFPSEDFGGDVTLVARRIGDTVVEFSVWGFGIFPGLNLIPDSLEFDSTDCSGTPRVIVARQAMMSMAWDEGDVHHYAVLPASERSFHSEAFYETDGSPCPFVTLPSGRCCRGNLPGTIMKNQADVVTFSESDLGVLPPLHVEGP
jgi:hypothetical protein